LMTDGFRVAADVDPIHFALSCSRETVERAQMGHGHGAGAANACAGGASESVVRVKPPGGWKTW